MVSLIVERVGFLKNKHVILEKYLGLPADNLARRKRKSRILDFAFVSFFFVFIMHLILFIYNWHKGQQLLFHEIKLISEKISIDLHITALLQSTCKAYIT